LGQKNPHIIQNPTWIISVALFLSLFLHLPHFSKELMSVHVWRQTQTQSTIDSFHEEDRNILNPRRNNRGTEEGIFRMEFPLMQWLIAGIYPITGRSILVTRIFMFLTGIACILGLFFFLRKLFQDSWIASLSAWAFTFSPAFYYYTLNPLPDVFALALSIWGMALCWKNKGLKYILGLVLLSLGTLCKLPFGIFFLLPSCSILEYFGWFKFKQNATPLPEALRKLFLLILALVPPIWWYLEVIPGWKGNGIVQGLMENTVPFSQLADYFIHNLISTLPELLVNYAAMPFFVLGLFYIFKRKLPLRYGQFSLLGIALLAYFLFELNMIAKVHDYYLFPFYPLLFAAIGYGIQEFMRSTIPYVRTGAFVLLLLLPLTAWLRMQTRWNPEQPGFNPDLLIYQNELRKAVPEDALCIVGNDESSYIFFYYIHKKGWAFQKDEPSVEQLYSWRNQGAHYLYSDSREIEKRALQAGILDRLVLEIGSIKVYQLLRNYESEIGGGSETKTQ
jgi:hypothetical protein